MGASAAHPLWALASPDPRPDQARAGQPEWWHEWQVAVVARSAVAAPPSGCSQPRFFLIAEPARGKAYHPFPGPAVATKPLVPPLKKGQAGGGGDGGGRKRELYRH